MDSQRKEAIKQKITVAGISVAVGAVAWWILLVHVFGWVGPTTAQRRISNAVQSKVDEVLAPVCAQRLLANKAALAKFAEVGPGYDGDEIVQATVPKIGSTSVGYRLANDCAAAIEAQLKSASRGTARNFASRNAGR
jgi:hypothetical protein